MTEIEFLDWLSSNRHNIQTPAYVYSESGLERSLTQIRSLFPANSNIHYSLKANPQPGLIRFLNRHGVKAEIASAGELHMCKVAGLKVSDILIGGVTKSSAYLAEVCASEPEAVVIESQAEWARLIDVLSPTRKTKVLLRVNPGVALGGLDMAGNSQFGLEVDQAIQIAKDCLERGGVEFIGLHFYFGSQRLSPEPIIEMLNVVCDVIKSFLDKNIDVSVVDVGLGCGVPYLEKDKPIDLSKLRSELTKVWDRDVWKNIEIWCEVGRALVAPSGYYVATVVEKKTLNGKTFVFLDGGLSSHNPGIGLGRFFRSNPRTIFVTQSENQLLEKIDIVGNLCTSADKLGTDIEAPILEEGDLVVVPNSGAYCQTTAMWGFNSQGLFSEYMLKRDGKTETLDTQYSTFISSLDNAS